LLLPALSRAKLKATQANCLSNQKQLSTALIMYSTDNQDILLPWPKAPGGGTVGGFNAMDGYIYINTPINWNQSGQSAQICLQNWTAVIKSTANPLFPYAQNPQVIHCPGDVRFRHPPGNGWAMDSYSKPNGIAGEAAWGGSTYTKMAQVFVPTETFAFREDCDSRGYNVGTWVVQWNNTPMFGHSQSFTWVDPLPMYHGNVSTSGFVDGHAEYHKWLDGKMIAYGLSIANGGAFNPPATTAGPDYEYVYMRYRFPTWAP
jgi:prepilin-type processing-associated H-X9-DG protein